MKLVPVVSALVFVGCVSIGYRIMAADAPATTPDAAAQATNAHDVEQAVLLKQGLDLAAKGDRQTAIHEYYDPVIAYYERTYADSHKHYFSARGLTEALRLGRR
jgi:hypothetical protein